MYFFRWHDFFGTTGGDLIALNPNGTLRWTFDAGDSIESSTVIGRMERFI
jgi:outer membrane protein assembly factor BamB